ncbi:MAG TPA: hypothetical protein VGF06_06730 [Terriglobales bacterium]|jgi:hypothetical protein
MSTPAVPPSSPSPDPAPIPALGEEYGTAKKNLPPLKILLIVGGILLVVVGILAFVQRPQSPATGSIDEVEMADVPSQGAVIAAINVSLHNGGESSFKMRSVKAEVQTGNDTHCDEPASAVDFDRYLQAFPTLKAHALSPLKVETIAPGGDTKGTILVVFPVTTDAFGQRKSLKVTIEAYGEVKPLVLTK